MNHDEPTTYDAPRYKPAHVYTDAHHRHEWAEVNDPNTGRPEFYACIECADTAPPCNTCHRRPADRGAPICDPCVTRENSILDRIRATIDGVPDTFAHLIGLKAIDYDRDPVQGGNDETRLPHGLDRTVDDWFHGPAGINTRTGALEILHSWADRYAELRQENPGHDVITYLRDRITWAATTLDPTEWADYRQEVRTVNGRIQALTDYPTEQRTGSECLDCGGRLIQEWTARDGLNDHITCSICGREYSFATHVLAVRAKVQAAATERPDALVTIAEAKRVLPTARGNTLDVWAHRAKSKDPAEAAKSPLTMRGRARDGKPLFRLGDITDALETRGVCAS